MEGYLQMWQGYLSRWSRYYFRIHEDLLMFGPSKEEIQGRVHLKVAQIISKMDDPVSLTINTGTDIKYLRAYSIDEKVKWYRRLKQAQKSIQQLTQNKELFKMKMQLSKVNRFKILDDLNTELWKCHAELEQRFEEVILKTKNVMIAKNIDKLRMSIDEFKYKTSQMLQYIDQQIRDLKNKQEGRSYLKSNPRGNQLVRDSRYSIQSSSPINLYQETMYYSFDEGDGLLDSTPLKNKPSRQFLKDIREVKQDSSQSDISFINRSPMERSGNIRAKRSFNRDFIYEVEEQKNPIKYRLFNNNKVYQQLHRDIFSRYEIRRQLPAKYTPEQTFPVLKTVSASLSAGDLTKVTMPVILNEPISALQKGCEQLYYSELLNKAEEVNDENMRILYVAAYAFSIYSLNEKRTKKPFNPLLGQTFEYIDENRGIEFLSEQVSHHPPISAFYVRSNNFELYDNNKSTISFSGNSIKMVPTSKTVIKLQKFQDYYTFNKCTIALANILLGRTSVQIYGSVQVKCKQNKAVVKLDFSDGSMWKKGHDTNVKGYLQNNGKKIYTLQGQWDKQLRAQHIESNQTILLWSKTHSINSDYYNFNQMTLQLNHLSIHNSTNLPPTDSRFRPDQKALEHQNLQLAAEQKHRLQEKQRTRRKQYEKNKMEHKMLWFKQTVLQNEDVYVSNQRYWGQKMKGNWKQCLDIY